MKNFTCNAFKSLLLIFFIGSLKASYAQTYVTIPDPAFASYLQTTYPSCMNGNQLNTTCSEIISEDVLIIQSLNLTDLEGVQYFTSLAVLNCGYNQIVHLPALPPNLELLICGDNQLTSLPQLPASLWHLEFKSNQVATIPVLPAGLTLLDCSYNPLGGVLPVLPDLESLSCDQIGLTALPLLPQSLKELDCDFNQLTSLPIHLPPNLEKLSCGFNQLTMLPELPAGLKSLYCLNNLLTALPEFPLGLTMLDCGQNQLITLPALPAPLQIIRCENNKLTAIPAYPDSLISLTCYNNQISCFSRFPEDLLYLDFSANPYACVPNYISVMSIFPPLCVSNDFGNNPYGCEGADGISGVVYKDNDVNCMIDTTDTVVRNIGMLLYDNAGGFAGSTWSHNQGVYYFLKPEGTYTIAVDTVGKPYTVTCITPGVEETVTTTAAQPFIDNVDFLISCKPGFDLGVQAVIPQGWIFPGQEHQLFVIAGEMGQWYGLDCPVASSPATVTVDINGPVTYQYETPGSLVPANISGTTLTYAIDDFSTFEMFGSLAPVLLIDSTAQVGDTICVTVTISTTASGETYLPNNTYSFCYGVVNSHDPNRKEVTPVNVEPGYEDYFTYTVHFQNTGSAPALNIRLRDTLDPNLDPETFEVIYYSHPVHTVLTDRVLTCYFNNIMLADSTSDPEGSMGFVQYRVKPKANLPAGTQIMNTASIYFDFNDPIETNTTINEFTDIVGIAGLNAGRVSIYPNPGKGLFTIQPAENSNLSSAEVYTAMGEYVMSVEHPTGTFKLDIAAYPAGIYFVHLLDEKGRSVRRLVKQ